MKEYYAGELKPQMDITDFFMIKSVGIKTGSNKKQYLDILLCDRSGEVNSKKWDISEEEIPALSELKVGDIVKVRGNTTDFNNQTQLRIGRIRLANENDHIQVSEYVLAAPEDSDEMFDYIRSVADNMEDQDLRTLCLQLLDRNRERLLYYPAASRNHHAEYGGLLYHVKRMLMTGLKVCTVYTNLNKDLVAAGVILHDIEKLNEIISDKYGISPGYSREGQLLGHIIQGVKLIDRESERLGIPEEKALMLEHMILSHHYEPEYGSPKKPLFPEAELLHYLDILDARMFDMESALANTEPGEFSDRVWTLDNRRLYKAVWDEEETGATEEPEEI